MKLQITPKFPAVVLGTGGITVTRANGVYTFGIDTSAIASISLDNQLQINEGHLVSQRIPAVGKLFSSGNVTAGAGFNSTDCYRIFLQGTFQMDVNLSTSAPPGFSYSLEHQITTAQATLGANDLVHTIQHIEGYRTAKLAWGTISAQPIAYGEWWWSSIPITFTVFVANSDESRNYLREFSIPANVWTFCSTTFPGCTDGTWDKTTGRGIIFAATLGVGSAFIGAKDQWLSTFSNGTAATTNIAATNGAIVRRTGLCVLPGLIVPAASQIWQMQRSYGDTLLLAQRYLEKSYDRDVALGAVSDLGTWQIFMDGLTNAIHTVTGFVPFKVEKRITPTITGYSPVTGTSGKARDLVAAADVNAVHAKIGMSGFLMNPTANGSATSVSIEEQWMADAHL